ncbi:MAG: hypothetical protein ACFWT6_12015 [Virgibacillus proomii]|jgi:hypothetical protein
MKKYRVQTDRWFNEFETLEKAEKEFNWLTVDMMSEGVTAYETNICLVEYDEDTEEEKTLKEYLAVVDERPELGTPKEEGYPEWNYWAKWQDVTPTEGGIS